MLGGGRKKSTPLRHRWGGAERRARRVEILLLLLVLLVLLAGALLVTLAKTPAVEGGARPLDINTATAGELARALGVPASLGARLVEARSARGGFADVDALGRVRDAGKRLVSPVRLRTAEPGLIVRPWLEARRQLWLWTGLLAAFFLAAHLWLRHAFGRADPFLLPVCALLSVLGVLLLFALKDPLRDRSSFVAQAQGVVLGGGVAFLLALSPRLHRLPLHRYGYVYAVAAVAGTVLLGVLGSGPGGVKLSVGGTQPVEIIKILLVFFLAAYLAERGPLLNDPLRVVGPFPVPRRRDIAPLVVMYALPLALFALVKDLGPVLLLFGTFLLLVYLATSRSVYVWGGALVLALGGWVGYRLRFGVFETRVDMWLSPWSNAHRGGDQLAAGLWAMASGGLFGSGLGLGGPRFIPRGGSDLVFASLGEELGLVGSVLVVVCFLVVIARGLRIAQRAGTDFDRYLAAGLSGLLALQATIIVGGTLGLLPLAGITLPFVSYGKSSLVASFFIAGFLLALGSKPLGANVAPNRSYRRASHRVGVFFAVALGLGGVARLVWVQFAQANVLAGRTVRVPDADGRVRDHVNPRLLALAKNIKRGRILDRNGNVLAETRSGKRVYPRGRATAHVVGYLDPVVGGPAGIEREQNATLRGFNDWHSFIGRWRAKDLPGFRLPRGADVTLSLDADLQEAALAALVREARRVGKKRGAVVVMDVATGGVLAAATSPTFDPSALTPAALATLTANKTGDFALLNRAVNGRYPPGSTFKIVTAAALFSNNQADFTHTCRHVDTNVLWRFGGKGYGRERIVDDESERAHGLVNLSNAVSESCNIFFAHAGLALGPQALRDAASSFGFAKLPGLTRFAEDLPDVAYGQGTLLASPLEMAGVAQTVAAGGRRLAPTFLQTSSRALAATPMTPEAAARLSEMMQRVTISGTAAGRFADLPFSVAGKTGTAQNDQGDRRSHSWFIGFAPADNPRVAFAVVVENGGYGGAVAVPIARDVLGHAALGR